MLYYCPIDGCATIVDSVYELQSHATSIHIQFVDSVSGKCSLCEAIGDKSTSFANLLDLGLHYRIEHKEATSASGSVKLNVAAFFSLMDYVEAAMQFSFNHWVDEQNKDSTPDLVEEQLACIRLEDEQKLGDPNSALNYEIYAQQQFQDTLDNLEQK